MGIRYTHVVDRCTAVAGMCGADRRAASRTQIHRGAARTTRLAPRVASHHCTCVVLRYGKESDPVSVSRCMLDQDGGCMLDEIKPDPNSSEDG